MRDFRSDPITESTTIHAPIARCFALSTRIELVKETLGMNLVENTENSSQPGTLTSGHITANSRVHWRGWKFGLPTSHHTLITGFAAPHPARLAELHSAYDTQPVAWFQDTQERGRFAFFQHDHYFRESPDPTGAPITTLEDEIRFTLPFGPLGRLAANLLLAPHIRKLARQRFARIKSLAEGKGWRDWITE
jgi:ligand-binding SRPBCC domain-containing protein